MARVPVAYSEERGGAVGCIVLFFFSSRRRHTRFDCDWSSDVCSSDLARIGLRARDAENPRIEAQEFLGSQEFVIVSQLGEVADALAGDGLAHVDAEERSEEHTSELQSQSNLVCRLLLEKKNNYQSRPA